MSRDVLLVEDEPALRYLLQMLLEEAGFEVRTVGRADDAIAEVHKKVPGVLVLDLRLPDKSGFDVLEGLSDVRDQTAIVVVTAQTSAAIRKEAEKFEVDAFIPKPFESNALMKAVEAASAKT